VRRGICPHAHPDLAADGSSNVSASWNELARMAVPQFQLRCAKAPRR
jgi:hypothetical protein